MADIFDRSDLKNNINKVGNIIEPESKSVIQSDFIDYDKILDRTIDEETNTSTFSMLFTNMLMNNNKNKITQDEAGEIDKNLKSIVNNAILELNKSTNNQYQNFIRNRYFRFIQYDAIADMIEYAKEAVYRLKSEILSPENITNERNLVQIKNNIFNVVSNSQIFNNVKSTIYYIKNRLKLDEKLDDVVNDSILYGEGYIEIVDVVGELKKRGIMLEEVNFENEDEVSILTEAYKEINELTFFGETQNDYTSIESEGFEFIKLNLNELKPNFNSIKSVLLEKYRILKKKEDIKTTLKLIEDINEEINKYSSREETLLEDEKLKLNDLREEYENLSLKLNKLIETDEISVKNVLSKKINVNRYLLKYHNPKTIIPLISGDMLVGYFKIENVEFSDTDLLTVMNAIASNPGMYLAKSDQDDKKIELTPRHSVGLKDLKFLINNSKKALKEIISIIMENNLNMSPESAKELLGILLYLKTTSKDTTIFSANKNILIRYIPKDNMEVIKTLGRSKFTKELGASLFERSLYKASQVISVGLALTLARVNYAMDIITINFDLNVPEPVMQFVNKLRDNVMNQKYALNGDTNIASIPSLLTNRQYIMQPSFKGDNLFSIDKIDISTDISRTFDDYKSLRDEFVAGLGIPPSILGLEENISQQSTLAQQNIMFAKKIVKFQKNIAFGIKRLLDKILMRLGMMELSNYFEVELPFPTSLKMTLLNDYISRMSELQQTLSQMGYGQEEIKTIFDNYGIMIDIKQDDGFGVDKILDLIDKIDNLQNQKLGIQTQGMEQGPFETNMGTAYGGGFEANPFETNQAETTFGGETVGMGGTAAGTAPTTPAPTTPETNPFT